MRLPLIYKENSPLIGTVNALLLTVYTAVAVVIVLAVISLFSGCAGLQKTTKEPLHAESGAGITIWKIPIVGLGIWTPDSWGGAPSVIIHRYDYQTQPQAVPPDALPNLPANGPLPITYQTIYGSAWDDPTLVIFKNDSYRRMRIQIDGQGPIVLEPYSATADMHFGIGEHRVRTMTEVPTRVHGTFGVVRFFTIFIRPEGRAQIFHLYDY